MTYDRNLHHRRSIRLATYDYGSAGAYLVTVCTHRRDCLLDDDELHTLAEDAWLTVVNATGIIDEFVVMPNHVHGIIWIAGRHPVGAQQPLRSIQRQESGSGDISLNVGTVAAPLQRPAVAPAVVPSSLGAIVRAFKSSASRRINNLRGTPGQFVWQRNY